MPRRGTKVEPPAAQDVGSGIDEAIIDPQGSLHNLSYEMKTLIQGVQKLRQLGVEDLSLPLPKIVVVGDQSTGKSSVIESLSEIQVPRSAGTCTRCPLEINLSDRAGDWKCNVYLSKKYVYDDPDALMRKASAKSEAPTRNRPLGRWVAQDTEDFHFHTITHKDDVPAVLRLAQLATLNPGTAYQRYQPGHIPAPSESLQVKFSPNVIRLDIAGPGLPNLAFYDLPGVINVVDSAKDSHLVDLVQNLVKNYIKGGNSINLLTLPMTDDPANSSALRLIRELKAGPRTVGCITKPDRLQDGESLQQWEHILHGDQFRLGHGYFVVKNDPDPEIDHAAARADEKHFFTSQKPWVTSLAGYSSRFGTEKLRSALSEKLATEIRNSMPRIAADIENQILAINEQLQDLPEPVQSNAALTTMMNFMRFQSDLTKHFDGGDKDLPFQSKWNRIAVEFRLRLAKTKPLITLPYMQKSSRTGSSQQTPSTPSATSSSTTNTACIDLSSDNESVVHAGVKRERGISPYTPTPTKMRRVGQSQTASKRFLLDEVRRIIDGTYTGGIPGVVHPKAIEEMIRLSMAHWDDLLAEFMESTQSHCHRMVNNLLHEVFGNRAKTKFFTELVDLVRNYLQELFAKQKAHSMMLLSWEKEKPRTLNENTLATARNEALLLLKGSFKLQRAHDALDALEKSGKETSGSIRDEKAAKLPEAQLGPDRYDLEVQAMSHVKGYYEIAYNRFVDILYSSIDCETFRRCGKELGPLLRSHFDVAAPDANARLTHLLQPSSHDQALRNHLLKQKATLLEAQTHVQELKRAPKGYGEEAA